MENIILYLLVRQDMDSLNPGKACAQAHHAGTKLVYDYYNKRLSYYHEQLVLRWIHEGACEGTGFSRVGFSTVVVLAVDDEEMLDDYIEEADENGYLFGYVNDPTYPINDGKMTHHFPVVTCGYILAPKNDAGFLSDLELMK